MSKRLRVIALNALVVSAFVGGLYVGRSTANIKVDDCIAAAKAASDAARVQAVYLLTPVPAAGTSPAQPSTGTPPDAGKTAPLRDAVVPLKANGWKASPEPADYTIFE